jgi:hypothetical protein
MFARLNRLLDGPKFDRFMEVVTEHLVDTNVFLRSLVLSLQFFKQGAPWPPYLGLPSEFCEQVGLPLDLVSLGASFLVEGARNGNLVDRNAKIHPVELISGCHTSTMGHRRRPYLVPLTDWEQVDSLVESFSFRGLLLSGIGMGHPVDARNHIPLLVLPL